MNKISLYLLLILIYLGLSKSFAPSEQANIYIPHEFALQHQFESSPISIILTDAFKTGFLIHTHFHRYSVVHVFKPPEDIYVRTSERFWNKHLAHIGMSIMRRNDREEEASMTPMPPGFQFLGDPAYGSWQQHESGRMIWQFHNAYREFPKLFGWGDFVPDKKFYQMGLRYLENKRPYLGEDNEFGSLGKITQEEYGWSPPKQSSLRQDLRRFLDSLKASFSFKEERQKIKKQTSNEDLFSPEKDTSPSPIPVDEIKEQLGEKRRPKKADDSKKDLFQFEPTPSGDKNE